jgi:erythromycin esterase-like protein
MNDAETLAAVRAAARWFEPEPDGFGPLMESIGDARAVLIGEPSHGTHEFYRTRAQLTKPLIGQKGFNVIAVEADWPDAYRVNRRVRRASDDLDAEAAPGDLVRLSVGARGAPTIR